MSFTNIYYKRATATAKGCYICLKPTTTVLSTSGTIDFFYTCPAHLTDPGFASRVKDEPAAAQQKKLEVSLDEIEKVKEEWEERQKVKKEKEKEKEKEKDNDDSKDGDKEKDKDKAKKASKSPPASIPTSGESTPKHERYALHRDYFAMRQGEHRKRRQTAQAKQLAPKLPSAPRGYVADAP